MYAHHSEELIRTIIAVRGHLRTSIIKMDRKKAVKGTIRRAKIYRLVILIDL